MANMEIASKTFPKGKVLKLITGDITIEAVDAIVNAANSHLQHGGGVAAAIVRRGGPIIQKESNRIGYVPVGEAAMTTGGALAANHVIHAVGPRWGEGDEETKLINAVRNSLALAERHHLTSISLPAISSGIFGFPKDRCAALILETAEKYLRDHPGGSLAEVRICLFDEETLTAFKNAFSEEQEG